VAGGGVSGALNQAGWTKPCKPFKVRDIVAGVAKELLKHAHLLLVLVLVLFAGVQQARHDAVHNEEI